MTPDEIFYKFYTRDEFENFICPECGLKFGTSVEVDRHLRQHTGEDSDGENFFRSAEVFSYADKSDNSTVTVSRLTCFDESSNSVEILNSVDLFENPTASEIVNERRFDQSIRKGRGSEQTVDNETRPNQLIENARRSEQPIENTRRILQPIENTRSILQPIENGSRSHQLIENGRRLEQPIENERTVEQNVGDNRSLQQLTEYTNVLTERQNGVRPSIDNNNVPQTCLKNHRKAQSRNHLIKSEACEQQPINDECSNRPIETENNLSCATGYVYEYVVKREVDYEIPNDLIEHLQTTTASTDDQLNTKFFESQNNFSDCMEDHGYGIQYSESTESHKPIHDVKITNFHNFDVHGAKQDSVDKGVTFQISADGIEHGYIQAVTTESRNSSIFCSPVKENVALQHHEQQTNPSHPDTPDHLTEIPETSTLQIPEKDLSSSINRQKTTHEQSPADSSIEHPGEVPVNDTKLDKPYENRSECRIFPPEATIDDLKQDDPTNDLPVLEKPAPLKNKRDSIQTMPHLEPVSPLNRQHEDLNSKESKQGMQGLAKGVRIGQIKEQVVSKHRKIRQFVCESFHCYKTFFSNSGLQKHMVKFHPGYVPLTERIFQTQLPISKSNKPKTVKHVRFSEKNKIHIIEPIFNLPHDMKNGKYVCLKCKGVFDDTLDLRQHLNKFKNKLHCDKVKPSKRKGKRKSTGEVNVRENPGCVQPTSELLDAVSEPAFKESNVLEMDTNECSSGTTDPAMDTNLPNTNNDDSELYRTTRMNPNVVSDKGKKSFACSKCSKVFYYKKSLMNHLKAHKDAEYRCEFCPSTFTLKRYLNEHKKSDHENKFQCPICHANFVYKNSFRKHMKKKHTISQSQYFF